MIIHLDKRFNGGLGDTVWMSWLAEGSRDTADPIAFYTHNPRKKELLSALGQTVTDDWQNAIDTSPAYQREIDEGGRLTRAEYLLDHLNRQDIAPRRPTVAHSPNSDTWATRQSLAGDTCNPVVLLFPECQSPARTWPLAYWLALSEMLWQHNRAAVTCYIDIRLRGLFRSSIYEPPLMFLIAIMRKADLVLGNDSFPVHLAATLGVPAISIMGPTTHRVVYGHYPADAVRVLTSGEPCTGCFQQSNRYTVACEEQCASLMQLRPESVLVSCVSATHRIERPIQ